MIFLYLRWKFFGVQEPEEIPLFDKSQQQQEYTPRNVYTSARCLGAAVRLPTLLASAGSLLGEQRGQLEHGFNGVATALDTWSDASSETRPGLELAACKPLGIPAALQPSNHPARTAYSVLLRNHSACHEAHPALHSDRARPRPAPRGAADGTAPQR